MKHIGDTEQSSPSPILEEGERYWVRSKVTKNVQLIEAKKCLYSARPTLNILSNIKFERFAIFGPFVNGSDIPDFDALIEASKAQ